MQKLLCLYSTCDFGEERFAPKSRRSENPEETAMHHIEWSAHWNVDHTGDEDSVGERTDLYSYAVAGAVELIEVFFAVR